MDPTTSPKKGITCDQHIDWTEDCVDVSWTLGVLPRITLEAVFLLSVANECKILSLANTYKLLNRTGPLATLLGPLPRGLFCFASINSYTLLSLSIVHESHSSGSHQMPCSKLQFLFLWPNNILLHGKMHFIYPRISRKSGCFHLLTDE